MLMKHVCLLLILCFGFVDISTLSAQYYTYQNKVWAFGSNVGLDFTTGSPVEISTSINTGEGCASVCDSLGHLLFYSDGKKVYNKTGAIMPSGSSVVSFITNSTEQAALIIPVIGNANQYYLFSLEALGGGSGNCHLAYSIIDFTLAGGLGDVVASSMGTPLQDSLGENMIAIAGYNNNIWLVTHRKDTDLFLAYNIKSSGISGPMISATGNYSGNSCYAWSVLKESPNRKKIAQGIYKAGACYGTQLYDFDPNTGTVSNCTSINTTNDATSGVEFSPDNTKLYLNDWHAKSIYQYDISVSTTTAIQASKYIVTDSSDGGDLRLGPDGKIYFEDLNTPDLNCIRFPNLRGAACGYIAHVVAFPYNAQYESFPNLYVSTDTVNRVGISVIKTVSNVTLYPNPTSLSLSVTSPDKINQITITNLIGQTLFSNNYNTEQVQIDVANLPPGMYLIRINGTEIRKFVKQ